MITAGIDVGAKTVKVVILKDGQDIGYPSLRVKYARTSVTQKYIYN